MLGAPSLMPIPVHCCCYFASSQWPSLHSDVQFLWLSGNCLDLMTFVAVPAHHGWQHQLGLVVILEVVKWPAELKTHFPTGHGVSFVVHLRPVDEDCARAEE